MKLYEELPTGSIWGFLFLVFIFRLVYIYIVPLELVPDEAYYWDWSRHLDIGYYSKPPMVAWLNYISTNIFGINEFGVRFFAALFGTLSIGILYLIAKEMFDEKVALISSLVALLTPGNSAMSLIMTIDPPLLFFGSLSLYFLWRIVASSPKKNMDFVLLGISVGLGFLSKQMMIVFFVLIFVFLFINRELRPIMTSFGFFIFLFISISLMSLPMYWNYAHGWVTFQETMHHVSSNSSIIKCIKTFFEYIGGQLLIITPILCSIVYFTLFKGMYNFNKLDIKFRFLFLFGGIPLIFFLLFSLKQRINANWPALFYPSAIIFAIAWMFKFIEHKKMEKYINLGFIVAYLFVFLTYISPFIFTIPAISGTKIDPTTRGKGWRDLAIKFDNVYRQQKDKHKLFILSDKRDIISELAFYMEEHPIIYKWDKTPNIIKDQYEVWGGPGKDKIGYNGLIVLKKNTDVKPLARYFQKIVYLHEIKSKLGKNRYRIYKIFKGISFRGF